MHRPFFSKRKKKKKTAGRDTYLLQTPSNEHKVDGTESKLCDDEKKVNNITERGRKQVYDREGFLHLATGGGGREGLCNLTGKREVGLQCYLGIWFSV